MDAGEEAELVARARGGDMRAFGALVDAHQQAVRGFLRRLTGNSADADDLSQEAFARAWEVLDRYDDRASLRSFVCGIGYNVWRGTRRARSRARARDEAYSAMGETETEQPTNAAARLALRRAMDDLPHDQSAALALCLGAEFTHAEAAEALGLPLGTVKSHVTRGRARLRVALGLEPEQ